MYRGKGKLYKVVYRPDEQYAIWYEDAPRYQNWQETGTTGTESECWDYVEAVEDSMGYLVRFPDHL